METLKDFFSDLKDRISNPFISSFVISWLIVNYKIVAAVLFYKVANYDQFILIVEKNSDDWVAWKLPLLAALFYTFVFQILKLLFKSLNSWLVLIFDKLTYRLTDKLSLTIKEHTISMTVLEKEKQALESLVVNQSAIKTENEKLTAEIALNINKHDEEIKEINKKHDERVAQLRKNEEERIVQNEKQYQIEIKKRDAEIQTYHRRYVSDTDTLKEENRLLLLAHKEGQQRDVKTNEELLRLQEKYASKVQKSEAVKVTYRSAMEQLEREGLRFNSTLYDELDRLVNEL